MPQDLIVCRKRRKLKALIPRLVVFVNDPSSAERRIDFAVFFIVLWSYGRKIYICVSPCPPECYLQSETKIEPDLRLAGMETIYMEIDQYINDKININIILS